MAGKDDDFDEWLDDFDDADVDLDQDNIDELLSSVEAEEGKDAGLDPGEQTSGELDQANIDALLGLSDDAEENGKKADDDNAALEQDNIDALLAGADDTSAPADEEEEVDDGSQAELDQDDIDSLLGAPSEESESEAEPAAKSEEATDDQEQDNINALFDDIDAASEPEESGADQMDDNLEELFAEEKEASAAAPAEAEAPAETGKADEEEKEQEQAGAAFDSELDEMDQLFADLDSDIDEEDPFEAEEIDFAEMLGESTGEDDQEFIELDADESVGAEADAFMARAGAEDDADVEAVTGDEEEGAGKKGLVLPLALTEMNRTTMAGIGGAVILLLLIGLFFLFSGGTDEAITTSDTFEAKAPTKQTTPRPEAENFTPVSEDNTYEMGDEAAEISLELAAFDKDDQPLIYEIITPPSHGRLSGTAPHLTYLPDSTFPGQDRFEFTASDGSDTSNKAQVTITGPDLATLAKEAQQEQAEEESSPSKSLQPRTPVVRATDARYATVSTEPVIIDWARLWQETNHSPYAAQQVHVEIVDARTHGKLERRDAGSHLFRPDPYQADSATIRYRFKKGGFRSTTQTVRIDVALGSPAPEINIAQLNEGGYLVGQKVVIDASASRDEARESLQFSWQQVAGVPIALYPMNDEGSRVAFTMPSSFYTDAAAGPTLALTVVDNTGKEVGKEIHLKTISRRQTALWRGENGNVADDPPMAGRYFPWPFQD
ncbi:MAG: hypothetical protein C0613_02460 [Desulfobulbaceae bacterium]|nr:MAG: hypothetical protein C0613_02460 [Desulfobulbaceae bacterium]